MLLSISRGLITVLGISDMVWNVLFMQSIASFRKNSRDYETKTKLNYTGFMSQNCMGILRFWNSKIYE